MSARGALVGVMVCAALASGCAEEHAAPPPSPPSTVPTAVPPYDASLPPAQAALALVPDDATTVWLVDWEVIRRQVGLPELTSRSSTADRVAFRSRAAVDAPVVGRPLLDGVDARLRAEYGFGADDVAWEAHWSGGGVRGWSLAFAPEVDMTAVRDAARAGVGPLRNAVVDRGNHLVGQGISVDGPVFGSDPTWARLVPDPGEAFVVRRGCVEPDALPAPPGSADRLEPLLRPLAGFAVTFGDHVATVRTEQGRTDLFARVGLARSWSAGGGTFGQVFRSGVADPSGGRIGYDVPHPARAAALARRGLLPFGVCAPGA